MTKREAISEVICAFLQVCGEFCCSRCTCLEEAHQTLYALGVSREEIESVSGIRIA